MDLYVIAKELDQIIYDSNATDGELSEEQARQIEDLLSAGSVKAGDLLAASQEAYAEAQGILDEVRRLDKLYRQRMRRYERLRQLIGDYMDRTKQEWISTLLGTIHLHGSSPKVRIDGDWEAILPEQFVRHLEEKKPDLSGLLRAYKAGQALPDGVKIEHGKHIVVR